MRIAILSDIHSNLEALQAVVKACQQRQIEYYFCIGDIVGYGANPKECLDIVAKLKCVSVAGNHDWAVSGKLDAAYFTEDGKAAVFWTRNNLDYEILQSLSDLPTVFKNDVLMMVHGSVFEPQAFHYLDSVAKAEESFKIMDRPLCFVGHTHQPQVYIYHQGNVYLDQNDEFEIKQDVQYIVNVGSVGQPRDGNPLAAYCIYDTDLNYVEVRRVQYDISSAQQKIIAAGLPRTLAHRLEVGK